MAYTTKGKSLEELLDDLEAERAQSAVGAGAYELVQAAIAVRTAQATTQWARVASVASACSALVAVAALVVAIAG
jgi:hypothetical protein